MVNECTVQVKSTNLYEGCLGGALRASAPLTHAWQRA
jgi:hypothetical protein